MVVSDANSWVYTGTGLVNGSVIPDVVASDFDHVLNAVGEPTNLQVLAHSPVPVSEATVSGMIWGGVSYSDMVYFTNPTSHAGTLDTGNNVWVGDLIPCTSANPRCPAPLLTAITNNILRVFGQGPAGLTEPSTSNVASIWPAGS